MPTIPATSTAASLKTTVRAGIAATAVSSFLAGFFLMLSVANWVHTSALVVRDALDPAGRARHLCGGRARTPDVEGGR